MTKLVLSDGTTYEGQSFGSARDIDGEVVFNTGMAGYVESLTDPSYRGQILVFTYPLIGNYGVPSAEMNEYGFSKNFESEEIHVRGVIVTQQSPDFSHFNAVSSIHNWLEHHNIPGITGVDTRALTKKLREHGVMLGAIDQETKGTKETKEIKDPNLTNLVAEVSCKEVKTYEPSLDRARDDTKVIAVYDCGIKNNILRSFLKRGVKVHRLPWDFDLDGSDLDYDAVFISNGPGDPKMCKETIDQVGKTIEKGIPTFGICLGTQILALAVGGDTYKLKYGHRGVNQPCQEWKMENGKWKISDRCIITSQNHGFAVDEKSLPSDWKVWFTNANDQTVEGIMHESEKFFAVQFHPEATPGPEDANYLFDEFVESI
ncbi:MAG: glutamine-hydrolyzing carbamoyl-phosphate synthase small subunit [Candidatus Peribacteraceae bacterium]|jgi:carbamoyl-phosphate synthase small subunit|nr:carbamoyl phosphate synthase small subunit [Parcubacteria group bacterium]MDP6575667.1 glutamine-hydrolyzing carbamoyl-phosphate synthase small subunit [Candidatus Peribacteraceae bacterium]HCI03356.1 carbamoyl-phosphate synthase (glutamine-hydrolyzing) small subunit [Candidatus Peribacteria bacterium]